MTVVVNRWRASAAGFEEQKHRLFHHFTNRTGHRLTLAGKWLDSGQWLEQPRAVLASRVTQPPIGIEVLCMENHQ